MKSQRKRPLPIETAEASDGAHENAVPSGQIGETDDVKLAESSDRQQQPPKPAQDHAMRDAVQEVKKLATRIEKVVKRQKLDVESSVLVSPTRPQDNSDRNKAVPTVSAPGAAAVSSPTSPGSWIGRLRKREAEAATPTRSAGKKPQ